MGKTLSATLNDDHSPPGHSGSQDGRRALPLRLNFSWTLLGNIIYCGCQWGILVVLTKLGTTEMVGRFGLALAVTAPVIMFSNLQLRALQATDARRDYDFSDYLGLRLLTTTLAMLAILGFTSLSHYPRETALVIVVIGLAKSFESISDILYGLFQQRERMDRIALSMIIRGILSLAALTVGVYLTRSLLWGSVCLAVVWAVILVIYDIPNTARVLARETRGRVGRRAFRLPRLRWNPATLRTLTSLSLPLGFMTILISLNENVPRYFVSAFMGERQLGIFVSMAYMQVAGSTVVRALGQSACARLASCYVERNMPAYRNLMLKLLAVGLVISLAGVTIAWKAGHLILTVFYKPEYAAHSDTFVWLMVAAAEVHLAMFMGYGLTAARRLSVQTALLFAASATTTITCALLVRHGGLNGVAISLVLGNFVWLAGSVLVLMRVFGAGEWRCERDRGIRSVILDE